VGTSCTASDVPQPPACAYFGGAYADGAAVGFIACDSTVCGSGGETWLCDFEGSWEYAGAACTMEGGATPPGY